jgi:hypothetical protein
MTGAPATPADENRREEYDHEWWDLKRSGAAKPIKVTDFGLAPLYSFSVNCRPGPEGPSHGKDQLEPGDPRGTRRRGDINIFEFALHGVVLTKDMDAAVRALGREMGGRRLPRADLDTGGQ